MKISAYTLLVLFLIGCLLPVQAQFISKKEMPKIDDLLKELSIQNKPAIYLIKGAHVLTMLDTQIIEQDTLIGNGVVKKIRNDIIHPTAIKIDGKGKYLIPKLIRYAYIPIS